MIGASSIGGGGASIIMHGDKTSAITGSYSWSSLLIIFLIAYLCFEIIIIPLFKHFYQRAKALIAGVVAYIERKRNRRYIRELVQQRMHKRWAAKKAKFVEGGWKAVVDNDLYELTIPYDFSTAVFVETIK